MKTKKTRFIKNAVSYILSIALFVLANFGLINILAPEMISYGANGGSPNEISIENSNFSSDTSNTYPFSPTGWVASSDEDTSSVDAGVINLEADDYKDIYSKNPNSDDNYVLMINSQNVGSDFSYTTKEPVDLGKSSNYEFTVDVYTDNNNGIVNLYLMQEDTVFASLINVSSQNGWSTFHFFVSTNDVDDLSLNLKLNAKNAGVALFDNVSCNELNDSELETRMRNLTSSQYQYIDESNKYQVTTIDLSQNGMFANFSSGDGLIADGLEVNDTSFDGSTNSAFKVQISNDTPSYAKYETADDFITIEQNKIYKIS